ncbi:hypothetical protein PVAP13_5NG318942 [Panicum virgatum]|uniref:Uncharacterized protein n=1 Tax=Panicum virgatum TaxID=38727 RepID=A0A8T0RWB6_PANVG|nr:hypothetical protein PVAP13_5NG318942 [Panicum virgatum]
MFSSAIANLSRAADVLRVACPAPTPPWRCAMFFAPAPSLFSSTADVLRVAWRALPQLRLLQMPPDRSKRLAREARSGRREVNLHPRITTPVERKRIGEREEEFLDPSRQGNGLGNFFYFCGPCSSR